MSYSYPTKKGFRLTPEGEDLYFKFISYAHKHGCTCFVTAPCGVCTHEGNPSIIEDNPQYWTEIEPVTIDWFKINGSSSRS